MKTEPNQIGDIRVHSTQDIYDNNNKNEYQFTLKFTTDLLNLLSKIKPLPWLPFVLYCGFR